jgi:hypothetical protein
VIFKGQEKMQKTGYNQPENIDGKMKDMPTESKALLEFLSKPVFRGRNVHDEVIH